MYNMLQGVGYVRVIAGTLRGRRIEMADNLAIRPTSDKARGAVFSSLGELIPESCFLDVFAGTGAMGIEAVSRGARTVVAVERSPRAAALIVRNRDSLGIDPLVLRVRIGTYTKVLPELLGQEFDVVFADPPYGDLAGAHVLELIDRYDLLAARGALIIEHFAKESLPAEIGKLRLLKVKNYGQTVMSHYMRAGGSKRA
ncbi:MAG: Ribosomal RNA small subunit methyltransferase D [Firmicutes bacterium]|nr:Ribosomal RNA small subunit methyltransferase D [candidate division NPL-UPA2 bacterium]MBT9156988.1 Ribosomal RNA small subunit methyltransferase D [candidate division NPL-UPA2 bacterium]